MMRFQSGNSYTFIINHYFESRLSFYFQDTKMIFKVIFAELDFLKHFTTFLNHDIMKEKYYFIMISVS